MLPFLLVNNLTECYNPQGLLLSTLELLVRKSLKYINDEEMVLYPNSNFLCFAFLQLSV
jgi:hypothetical protein